MWLDDLHLTSWFWYSRSVDGWLRCGELFQIILYVFARFTCHILIKLIKWITSFPFLPSQPIHRSKAIKMTSPCSHGDPYFTSLRQCWVLAQGTTAVESLFLDVHATEERSNYYVYLTWSDPLVSLIGILCWKNRYHAHTCMRRNLMLLANGYYAGYDGEKKCWTPWSVDDWDYDHFSFLCFLRLLWNLTPNSKY